MGEMRSEVRDLCWRLSNGSISEQDFKDGIRRLLDRYGLTGYMVQNVGLAVDAAVAAGPRKDRIRQLVEEVVPEARARVESWVLSLPLEVEFHATSQPSKNCAFDGSVDEQDEDCVILHVVGGSDTFRMTVKGQIFHSPGHKDCIQKWAHARAQVNPENHSLYVQLIAWADAIRSVADGYESGRR